MEERKIKQVIVIRKDLGMRRGKEITQGSHASSSFMTTQGENIKLSKLDMEWIRTGQTKITTKVDSKTELLKLFDNAKRLGLKAHLIIDEGRTEFNGVPTFTALAIGPDYADEVDVVTSELKLY